MRGKMLGVLLIVIFCLGMLTPAAASPIGFTGNPAQDNWVLQGNSLTLGTFIRGTGFMNFDVYSAAFYLGASSPLVGGQWQAGDLILGLGLVSQGTHDDSYYHDPRMVAKFGSTTAIYSPSSSVSLPGNGHGSQSGGNGGTGGVQVDFQYELTNGHWDNGQNLSGIIQTAANVSYYDGSTSVSLPSADYGRVLGIFPADPPGPDPPAHFTDQSFEVALDVSYLARGGYSPTPSQHGKADLAWQISTGNYTDAYVPNVGANVPVPGTLLLLGSGLVGVFGLRKKLRK
jgi:hypothetical protein